MPTYRFKCENKSCGRTSKELFFPLSQVANATADTVMDQCPNCRNAYYWRNVQVEFRGGINMNNSIKAKSYRRYRNKEGGPQAVVGGKIIGPSGVV
jgi:hypothetical protein